MVVVFHQILHWIAAATEQDLANYVEYLKAENEMLRSKLGKRVTLTPSERSRLVLLGQKCGAAIRGLITIVTYPTFLRWVRQLEQRIVAPTIPKKLGRRRTPDEIRELVLKLARENAWGYTRILGELKKLGVGNICRTTVLNILREAGLDPGPKHGRGSWSEFIAIHAETLYACDFFSKTVWTFCGPKHMYLLAFLHISSRKVYVSSSTSKPSAAWVSQQAENFVEQLGHAKLVGMMLLRDNDGKFQGGFDEKMKELGVEVKSITPLSPNLNAYTERWIQTIQVECIDHFVVLGERHLEYIVSEFLDFYHHARPHQNKANQPLGSYQPPEENLPVPTLADIECQTRLGGLLKSYSRKAARKLIRAMLHLEMRSFYVSIR